MYTRIKKFTGILLCVLFIVPMACEDDIDPVITDIDTPRAFAPVGLEARVRNQVDIELSWAAKDGIDQYLVEFYQDSLRFSGDPISTTVIEDFPSEGTITYTGSFSGETIYSARVRAVTEGLGESNWATIAVRTNAEQIFDPVATDIQGNSAVVSWIAGSEVTNLLIQPGNIFVPISDAQKAAGQATVLGLDGATDYTVTIYNGASKRGIITFATLKAITVTPLDDLAAAIDAATEGETLVLAEGEYNVGEIQVSKSVVIEGQKVSNKPIILGRFTFGTTISSFTVRNLDMRSDGSSSQAFNTYDAAANLGELIVDECEISGYSNNIMYNQSSGTYGDITFTNTYIHDIEGGGGDGFDFRGGNVGSLTVQNSTISNGIRTLLRMQVAADVVFQNCTFYKACSADNSNNRGFFRMSGGGNSLEVSNCLFVETGVESSSGAIYGNWSRAGDISEEVITNYSNNYYFNVIGLFEGEYTDPAQVDAMEADPGFEDPINGDFTITNQTLIDEEVGDSKWWF